MSEILESLRTQGEYVEEHLYPLSCKLKRNQQAAVEAVIACRKQNQCCSAVD